MEFLTSAQVDGVPEASGQLCSRIRDDTSGRQYVTIVRIVEEASVYGNGLQMNNGESAVLRLEVLFGPGTYDRVREDWVAHMEKEGRHWRVCGFERSE